MKKIIIIDVETAPCDVTFEGVDPKNMFAYDIGYAVCYVNGEVIKTESFINKEVFFEEEELMNSAYYSHKIPQYIEQIKCGKSKVASLYEIRKSLCDDIKKYGIKEVYAHNMRFDYGALNNTQRWSTKSKYRYFFPKEVVICDSLKMSRDVLGNMPTYKKFCKENGYMTKKNQLRFTAEILYRFISKDNEFIEEHKGLDDVLIEKEIVAYCYKQHKKMRKALYE